MLRQRRLRDVVLVFGVDVFLPHRIRGLAVRGVPDRLLRYDLRHLPAGRRRRQRPAAHARHVRRRQLGALQGHLRRRRARRGLLRLLRPVHRPVVLERHLSGGSRSGVSNSGARPSPAAQVRSRYPSAWETTTSRTAPLVRRDGSRSEATPNAPRAKPGNTRRRGAAPATTARRAARRRRRRRSARPARPTRTRTRRASPPAFPVPRSRRPWPTGPRVATAASSRVPTRVAGPNLRETSQASRTTTSTRSRHTRKRASS